MTPYTDLRKSPRRCNLPEVTPDNMDSLIGINLARLEPVCH